VELERPTHPDLDSLVTSFYARPEELGEFTVVEPDQIPLPYRDLLCHDHHMTVTIEAFHRVPVEVEVLSVTDRQTRYARRILLRRQSDQAVVQFGIVRLDLQMLDKPVRDEILAERTPLGRVLIEHEVLREVELHQLYQVRCGPDLAERFQVPLGTTTFGRTALIYCNGEPSVELLEIVAP
jgi:chorismate-pyruvate lyase